jgi:hypothetical protein
MRCALYIRQILPDFIKSHLLIAQIAYYNKGATINEVKKALKEA